jgi:hypothetical protein
MRYADLVEYGSMEQCGGDMKKLMASENTGGDWCGGDWWRLVWFVHECMIDYKDRLQDKEHVRRRAAL